MDRSITKRLATKAILALLLMAITLSATVGALADTTYVNVGQLFTIYGPTPIYTDTTLTKAVTTLNNGQRCVVVGRSGSLIEVYTLDSHKVGWMIWSNTVAGQQINPAIVLSSSVSLREAANTASKLVMSINHGEIVNVLSEAAGWYYVEYADRTTNTTKTGFLRVDFLLRNPQFIILQKTTDVYAMPQSGSKKVGQIASPNALVIIGSYGDYLCVNLRQASGFIRRADVGY